MPKSPPTPHFQDLHQVRALVSPAHQAMVRWAVADAGPPERLEALQFVEEHEALLQRFPYYRRASLIMQVDLAERALRSAPDAARQRILLGLVSGWDCAVLLVEQQHHPLMHAIASSALCPRVEFVHVATLSREWLSVVLRRAWWHAMHAWVDERLDEQNALRQKIALLPVHWQVPVLAALQLPHRWSVQLLADACHVSTRTLQRTFSEKGLPTPRDFLHPVLRTRPR